MFPNNLKIALVVVFFTTLSGCQKQIIFQDDFKGSLNSKNWKIETKKDEDVLVFNQNGFMIIDSKPGTTVWLNKKLKGNYKITYDRTVVLDSGKNDRLSDLNQFWMADIKPFTRDGVFEGYDNEKLYYIGFGGNYNSTTRFRKYEGNNIKPVLAEYLDSTHLLKPNHTYTVITTVFNGRTTWQIDGDTLVDYVDPHPLKKGYFGFRTTWSRQKISNIKIERL